MTTSLQLTARDPIVARDGRPFGAGQYRMRSTDWPLPSMVAGSLRTILGKTADRDFSLETASELLGTAVAGLFPFADGQLYVPCPQDCILPVGHTPLQARPQEFDDAGCDWPTDRPLLPVTLTDEQASKDFKPTTPPAWWPLDAYVDWLLGKPVTFDHKFLRNPEAEDRMHVAIDPVTGVSEDSKLFLTAALPLNYLPRWKEDSSLNGLHRKFMPIHLVTCVDAQAWCQEVLSNLDCMHTMGGERRLMHWKTVSKSHDWACPTAIREVLDQSPKRVLMTLLTPAIFSDGWKPGWLDEKLEGFPCKDISIKLRLKGVCIQRWRAISGWSLAKINSRGSLDPNGWPGPKPVKRMVPTGGVYYFEVIEGQVKALADLWMKPVSDDLQDQRDGFGLVAWGKW